MKKRFQWASSLPNNIKWLWWLGELMVQVAETSPNSAKFIRCHAARHVDQERNSWMIKLGCSNNNNNNNNDNNNDNNNNNLQQQLRTTTTTTTYNNNLQQQLTTTTTTSTYTPKNWHSNGKSMNINIFDTYTIHLQIWLFFSIESS